MRWFRYALGGLCLCAGFAFLTINSTILSRGAMRWATDWIDQWAYGIVAGFVPWVIAVMPFLIWGALKMLRVGWAVAGVLVYVVFIAYNVLGASGITAMIRSDVLAERQHSTETDQSRRDRRTALVAQRDAIAKQTRPSAQVKALLEAEYAKPAFKNSDQCKDPSGGHERKFCTQVAGWKAELGAAQQLEALSRQIAEIDEKRESGRAVSQVVDPDAQMIASFTGLEERLVSKWLPLRTPIVLEIGAMFLLGFAIVLFDLSHSELLIGQRSSTAALADSAGGGFAAPPARGSTPSPPPATSLTRQRELCEWFFRECTRPVQDGALPEETWYQHYQEICQRSQDVALPLAAFHRIAKQYVPEIREVGGRVMYFRYLPLIPNQEVA